MHKTVEVSPGEDYDSRPRVSESELDIKNRQIRMFLCEYPELATVGGRRRLDNIKQLREAGRNLEPVIPRPYRSRFRASRAVFPSTPDPLIWEPVR